jgi:hypothetical protein
MSVASYERGLQDYLTGVQIKIDYNIGLKCGILTGGVVSVYHLYTHTLYSHRKDVKTVGTNTFNKFQETLKKCSDFVMPMILNFVTFSIFFACNESGSNKAHLELEAYNRYVLAGKLTLGLYGALSPYTIESTGNIKRALKLMPAFAIYILSARFFTEGAYDLYHLDIPIEFASFLLRGKKGS